MNFNQMGDKPKKGLLVLEKNSGLLNLDKFDSLVNATVACGWKASQPGKERIDLDIAAFMLHDDGYVHDIGKEVVYYKADEQQGIKLQEDKRIGATGNNVNEDDEEKVDVFLKSIAPEIASIVFIVTIYEAIETGLVYGMTKDSYVRLINADTQEECLRFPINSNEYQTDTAIVFCKLVRTGSSWSFEPIGQGYNGDLNDILLRYLK